MFWGPTNREIKDLVKETFKHYEHKHPDYFT